MMREELRFPQQARGHLRQSLGFTSSAAFPSPERRWDSTLGETTPGFGRHPKPTDTAHDVIMVTSSVSHETPSRRHRPRKGAFCSTGKARRQLETTSFHQ